MSSYIVMIYGDEQVWESWTEEQGRVNAAAHGAFHQRYGAAVVGGHELERSHQARSVRVDEGGDQQITSGPFLAGPNVLGGYYVIEAADLDAAIALAKDLPERVVEVRPLVEGGN